MLTDNEIIKAWECCEDKYNCPSCPLLEDTYCDITLAKHSLNLINRQKAEIERLRTSKVEEVKFAYKVTKEKAIKEFAERLKEKTAWYFSGHSVSIEIDNLVKEMVGEK